MKQEIDRGVPEFQSPEEEREYWESRGPLAEGHKGKVTSPRPGQKRSSFLAVRLTGEELTRLRDVAARQGLGPSTFARSVLLEAVGQGTISPRTKTMDEVVQVIEESLPGETRGRMKALLKAITIGNPPYLLELSDTGRLEELTRLLMATFLSVAGIRIAAPEREEIRTMAAARTSKARQSR